MKLALCIQTPEIDTPGPVALLSGTFEEKVRKAAALDVEGVELAPMDPAALDAVAIRDLLRRYNLEVAAVATVSLGLSGLTLLHHDPFVSAQARSRLDDLIRFAAAVGAPLVTVGSFRGRSGDSGAEGRAKLARILREAASFAEQQSVRLVIEPMNRFQADFITTAEEGLSFLQEIGHPAVGLLLDTNHMLTEETSWSEPFRRVMEAGRLWHVHLADSNRRAPGHGLIDFGPILHILRDIGYAHYLSIEVFPKPDPDTAARDGVNYIRSLLEKM
ncbi:MAG: sugar phosphate isomerase/epimerase family protein [Anaerolineae bacterium]